MANSLWDKIILALDTSCLEEVKRWLRLYPEIRRVKVGMELFSSLGKELVCHLKEEGYWVFLDLKLHDIPNTMARSGEILFRLPADMLTIHIAAGTAGIQALLEVRDRVCPSLKIVGVTVLTSLGKEAWAEIFPRRSLKNTVLHLALLGINAGLDGVVASGEELSLLRKHLGPQPLIVVPGVRFPGDRKEDQKRVMSPKEALKQGASFLVMGRALTRGDPQRVRMLLASNA